MAGIRATAEREREGEDRESGRAMGLSLELRPPGALVRVTVWAAGVKDWSLEAGRSSVGRRETSALRAPVR